MRFYTQHTFKDGLAVKRETLTVDNITSAEQVGENAGTLESTLVYQYEDGCLVGFTVDADSDEVIDGDMVLSYNTQWGNCINRTLFDGRGHFMDDNAEI